MTLKQYLMIMSLTTVVCWLSFVIVLFRINPETGGSVGLLLFFISLFFALWGTLSLAGFFMRLLVKRQSVPFQHVGISLRQALWFALLVTISLFLVSQELFIWWMSLVLIVGLTLFEAFFLARSLQSPQRKKYERS